MGQRRLLSGTLVMLAGLAGSQSFAADLVGARPINGLEVSPALRAPRSVAIVVPACSERSWSLLLRCLPREEVYFPEELGLVQIQSTRAAVPRTPYPALVPR